MMQGEWIYNDPDIQKKIRFHDSLEFRMYRSLKSKKNDDEYLLSDTLVKNGFLDHFCHRTLELNPQTCFVYCKIDKGQTAPARRYLNDTLTYLDSVRPPLAGLFYSICINLDRNEQTWNKTKTVYLYTQTIL